MAQERSRWWRNLNLLALLGLIAVTAALLLSPSDDDGLLGLPELAVGTRAPRTVKAPRDFAISDPVTTARLRREASALVLPTYDLDAAAGLEAKSRLERAFAAMPPEPPPAEAGAPPVPPPDRSTVEAFMRALEVYLDAAELDAVVRAGFSEKVRDAAIMVVRTIHESRIAADRDLLRVQAPQGILVQVLDPETGEVDHEERITELRAVLGMDQAKAAVDELVARSLEHLSPVERRGVALLAKRLLRPNLIANPDETGARKARAEEAVRMVVIPIKRGETVLRAGEPATDRHVLIVNGMAAVLGAESRFQRPLGSALLAILLVVLAYRTARTRTFRPSARDLGLMTAAYIATLLATWMAYKGALGADELWPGVPASAWRALVPVAAGPLLLRFLIGRPPAHAFAALAAVTTGLMMDGSLEHAIWVLAGGSAAAVIAVDPDRPALAIVVGGLLAGLAQAAALTVLALVGSRWDLDRVLVDAMFALASGALTVVIVTAAVPIAEALFGYTSPLGMRELSSLNHPLLRELLVQAPGTYHHSIVVGALAEAAASAIGADSSLARVGGYYHDVGKLKSPRMFAENQRGRIAPDSGSFAESTPVVVEDPLTIRAHVSDGLEIAASHRLGGAVLDILAQHHGTSEVRVQSRISIRPEAAISYAGPRPLTREAGLVMLADRVEVAAEALLAAPPIEEGMLEATVSRVFGESLDQLADCPLTLADLSVAEREMVQVLRDILTRRGAPAGVLLAEASSPVYVVPPSAGRPN